MQGCLYNYFEITLDAYPPPYGNHVHTKKKRETKGKGSGDMAGLFQFEPTVEVAARHNAGPSPSNYCLLRYWHSSVTTCKIFCPFFCFVAFLILLHIDLQNCNAQPPLVGSSAFEMFQKFVTGQVDINEAVIKRKIVDDGGKVNQEALFRFGFRNGGETWFSHRLNVASNVTSEVGRPAKTSVFGESFSNVWMVSTRDGLAVAPKSQSAGSMPRISGSVEKATTIGFVALGIPCSAPDMIQWDGLSFKSRVVGYKKSDKDIEINGSIVLDSYGRPRFADYVASAMLSGAEVTYRYDSTNALLPNGYTVDYKTLDSVEDYEFRKMDISSMSEAPEEFLPSQFFVTNGPSDFFYYTNDTPYRFANGSFVPVTGGRPSKAFGGGAMALVSIFVFLVFLAIVNQRRINKKQQNKTKIQL